MRPLESVREVDAAFICRAAALGRRWGHETKWRTEESRRAISAGCSGPGGERFCPAQRETCGATSDPRAVGNGANSERGRRARRASGKAGGAPPVDDFLFRSHFRERLAPPVDTPAARGEDAEGSGSPSRVQPP